MIRTIYHSRRVGEFAPTCSLLMMTLLLLMILVYLEMAHGSRERLVDLGALAPSVHTQSPAAGRRACLRAYQRRSYAQQRQQPSIRHSTLRVSAVRRRSDHQRYLAPGPQPTNPLHGRSDSRTLRTSVGRLHVVALHQRHARA